MKLSLLTLPHQLRASWFRLLCQRADGTALTVGIFLAAVLIVPSPLSGTEDEKGQCLRRTVPVNVIDENGNQVWGLSAEEFRAEFRGKEGTILSVERDASPRRVVILLDVSDSMTEENQWELARDAVGDIVSFAPKDIDLAFLSFGEEVREQVGFGQGRQAIADKLVAIDDKLQGTQLGQKTAFFDAMLAGISLLGSPTTGDVVYAISDGADNRSEAKRKQVKEIVGKSDVRVYGFWFGWTEDPYVFFPPTFLERLIRDTGGFQVRIFATDEGLYGNPRYDLSKEQRTAYAAAARLLYGLMAETYRVEVLLPREVDKERDWKLEVVKERGGKRKELKVIYPHKLWPCEEKE